MGISATSQSSTCENSRTARCKKRGNTLIGTLRKTYGPHFAKGCADDHKLCDVLHKLDEPSLSALVEDHEAGTLEAGECVDAELNPPRLPYRCPLLYGPRRTGFRSASGRGRAEALVLPEWLLSLLKHVKARQPDIRQIPFTETL